MPDSLLPLRFDGDLSKAIASFWTGREGQTKRQIESGGVRDAGTRSSVTGGKHMDELVGVIEKVAHHAGLPKGSILRQGSLEIPGYFRATKQWDLLLIHRRQLLGAIEVKSQVGSFGNNLNNRTEEALGSATDFWRAHKEGLLPAHQAPWLGWLMLLEKSESSTAQVGVKEPHFPADTIFKGASYARRYDILTERLVKERHYSAATMLLSSRKLGAKGKFLQAPESMPIRTFAASLSGHIRAALERVTPE